MVSATIKVSEVGIARMKRFGVVLKSQTGHFAQDFLNQCHVIAMGDFAETFETEGSNIGRSWSPLKQTTINIRKRAGYPAAHPIHIRSGALARTMTTPNARGHSWRVSLNKRSGSATGTLRLNHAASRSDSAGQQFKGNLIEELTESSSSRRVSRPLYDKSGQGVSRAAVSEMGHLFYKWAVKMWKRLPKELQ